MARPPTRGLQFSDLSTGGKVACVVAAVAALAAGVLLPKWITILGIAVAFLAAFVIQRLRRKA